MNDGNTEQSNESAGDQKDPPGRTATAAPSPSAAPYASASPPVSIAASPTAAKRGGLLRRLFWLDDKVAQAEQKGFSKAQPGWPEFELSRQARAGIVQIGETGEGNAAVLLLERAEVLFLIRSHLVRRGQAPAEMSLSAEDWKR
ncbi:MAG TPA: hypothetical protein VIV60_06470, partial [Polyangiaceae bacterium]